MIQQLKMVQGREIVVDTRSPILYIGVVKDVQEDVLFLGDVDVHDCNDTTTTKEVYIMDSRKHGIRKNRNEVCIKLAEIVSFSMLQDVIAY